MPVITLKECVAVQKLVLPVQTLVLIVQLLDDSRLSFSQLLSTAVTSVTLAVTVVTLAVTVVTLVVTVYLPGNLQFR